MTTNSSQILTESCTSPTQKPKFMIRCYSHSDDLDRIRNMFVQSALIGPDAPFNVVTSRFAAQIVRACIICTAGLACCYALSMKSTCFARVVGFIEDPLIPAWITGAVSVASAFAAIYFWRQQSMVHNTFRVYIEDALANDLNDIPTVFGLSSREGNSTCFPVGFQGFWVAEEDDFIVGFIGFDMNTSNEEKIGEVRRMVVSPSHRRRGIGKELLDVVNERAEANGIDALELTTSDFHVGALKMYEKNGWRWKRPRIYRGVLVYVLGKDI